MALRQGFILIDETCAKHSSALEGLQSFAGAEIGASQRIHETLQRLSSQVGTLQHRTLEFEKNTSLDWRMQSVEDELSKLQVKFQGSSPLSEQDSLIAQLSQQVRELSQNPLWNEMQKTTVEVQHFKEKISPVMKDIESRLNQLELVNQEREDNQDMQRMKEKLNPVMADIEKRLIALETRPVETSISNVSFTEENPTTMTTLIERVQVLESRVNNLEPSNSTLHSSISSTPLEPPEDHRRKEGFTNEPSSSSTQERPTVPITQTYTMGELEGRLLKRMQAIESQLTQYGTQELPLRQRELETKLNRILQTTDLPSFGHDSSSTSLPLASLELRFKEMEANHESLATENKKLQARVFALEESRTSTKVNHVIDRLRWLILRLLIIIIWTSQFKTFSKNFLRYVKPLIHGMMNTKMMKRNSRKSFLKMNCLIFLYMKIRDYPMTLLQDLIVLLLWQGRATFILSSLELPLVKGSKRVFVRDAHLFVIGKCFCH